MTFSDTRTLRAAALGALLALPKMASAQYYDPYRRRRTGLARGAIAGIAIACACLALFCFVLAFFLRRRRLRAFQASRINHVEARPVAFQPPASQWNYQGPPPSQPSYTGAQPNYTGQQSYTGSPYQPEQPGYKAYEAPTSPPPPPPAYDTAAGAKDQTSYAPPPGSPPAGSSSQCAPPPGPPPAAHTTGKDDGTFIGGFRRPN
ncbi:hypothetical protein EV715DRAFT_262698 [Schizophyllum commune]